MNLSLSRFAGRAAIFIVVSLAVNSSFGVTTRWTNSVSGFWRDGVNWISNAVPSSTYNTVFITNATTKTVTIDALADSTNLTVARLSLSAPTGFTNTLRLVDLTTNRALDVTTALTLDRQGLLIVTNSALQADNTFDVTAGTLTLDGGLVNCANIAVNVGRLSSATGTLNLNAGVMQVFQLSVGSPSPQQQNAQGVVNIAGGSLNSSSQLLLGTGNGNSSTGIVTMTSGQLIATNSSSGVGVYSCKVGASSRSGFGQMNISGGTTILTSLSVGNTVSGNVNISGGKVFIMPNTTNDLFEVGNLGAGQFNLSGGSVFVGGEMDIAGNAGNPPFQPPGAGNMLISGGQLIATNDLTAIGKYYQGALTITNATVALTNVSVGRHDGATGTLNIQSNSLLTTLDDLSIARFSNSVGVVVMTGGLLSPTKDNIWVGRGGSGQMIVSNGTVQCRSIFVAMSALDPETLTTNYPTGTLSMAGGSAIISSNLIVGSVGISTGRVAVVGGNLTVADGFGGAPIIVTSGNFTQSLGTVAADKIIVTNASGHWLFNGGTLQAKSMTVANGAAFVVGDGVNPATLQLQGGVFNFANGLVISPNASVTGCGTIIGPITNNGTLATNCSGLTTGTVELQAFTGSSRVVRFVASQVSGGVTNYLQTNDVLLSFSAGQASYSISVPTNATHLSAKTAWNLRRRLAGNFTSGAPIVNFTGAANLRGGDLATTGGTAIENTDNAVTSSDYLLILGYYLQSVLGDPLVGRADVNGDGVITSSDYLILLGNYINAGDPQ